MLDGNEIVPGDNRLMLVIVKAPGSLATVLFNLMRYHIRGECLASVHIAAVALVASIAAIVAYVMYLMLLARAKKTLQQ